MSVGKPSHVGQVNPSGFRRKRQVMARGPLARAIQHPRGALLARTDLHAKVVVQERLHFGNVSAGGLQIACSQTTRVGAGH